MFNDNIGRLLENKEIVKLTKDDIFDKVINLKLTTDKGVSYVIRSDFEVVYPNLEVTKLYKKDTVANSNYYIRKCERKPSINVQYTRTANAEVNTGIDIYISNFYLLSADGNTVLSFSDSTNKLATVQIMLGYYGQFAARYNYDIKNITFDDLYDFMPGFGIDVITASVLYVSTEKMPPDATLHIHCEVGSSFAGEVGEIKTKNYNEIKSSDLIVSTSADSNMSYIEKLMYKYITRRFLKDVYIPNEGVFTISEGGASYMSNQDALYYGIKIYCSEGVKKISEDRMLQITDADGNEINRETFFAQGVDAVSTFNNINTAIGNDLINKPLLNGDWLVCTVAESDADDIKFDIREDVNGQGSAYFEHTLPAVYNINLGALSTITAPFFFFVNPPDVIKFKSKYKVTDIVQYYSDIGEDTFKVIKQTVSFATVDDLNEMTLVCVNEVEEKKDE